MNESEYRAALYDMLYLTSCGIHETAPDPKRAEEMVLENVFSVCSHHSLCGITCYALEKLDIRNDELMKRWKEKKNKAIRKNLLLDSERSRLAAFMEEKGIRYLPLKGIILKEMYPKPGMRQMSDNDILFDAGHRIEVREWFEGNGYKTVKYNVGYDDVYEKPPVFNYEMHTMLYSDPRKNQRFYDYYLNVWERAISENGSCGCRFSDEDFYIYVTSHTFKHFDNGGTGLRSLLDTYVFMSSKMAQLDMGYITQEAEKLGIATFERECRELSFKVFSSPEGFSPDMLSEDEREMLEFFLSSGTYGNIGNKMAKYIEHSGGKMKDTSKAGYIKKRLFPGDEHLKNYFPFFYRHKLLLPFLWVFRLFRAIIKAPRKMLSELKLLKKISK